MKELKRFFTRFVVVLLALQTVLAAQALTSNKAHAATPTTPSVIINEIMWAGSYSGTTSHATDEWVELLNTTDRAVDLTGWTLSGVGSTFTVGTDGDTKNPIISANGYYLISHYDLGNSSTILADQPDWILPSISLSNSCQPITFSNLDASSLDTADCNGGSYYAGLNDTTNHIRKSMERVDILNSDGTVSVGDGTSSSSWITADEQGNIDVAIGSNFASPKLFNSDLSAPTIGTVTTGPAWSTDSTRLSASWSGFGDLETGIDHYLVGYGTNAIPTASDISILQDVGNVDVYGFTSLNLSEGITYYAYVEAVNPVGLTSATAVSSGQTITHQVAPVTGLLASDVPGDNGGSVQLSWAASVDADHYLLSYSKFGSGVFTAPINIGSLTSYTISGLENSPVSYQFNITAVTSNGLSSVATSTIGLAADNLPPAPPTLNGLTATCQTMSCNVELNWQSNDQATSYYQISYTVNGVELRTMNIYTASIILALQPAKTYTFTIYSFDGAGNSSAASNQLVASLNSSQKIVVTVINGQQQTTVTSLLPVAVPVQPKVTPAAISYFVPATAQAAEPVAQPVVSNGVSQPAPDQSSATSSSDWAHLIIIVIILLLVALGFYRLSRTLREDENNLLANQSKNRNRASGDNLNNVVEKRGRGRPKGTTKKIQGPPKPKRGRGRPKGSLNKKKEI